MKGEEAMNPELVGKRVKVLMKKNNMTVEELAEKMEIPKKDLEIKLAGKEEFFIIEMHKIREIFHLNLKEVDELFFQKTSQK